MKFYEQQEAIKSYIQEHLPQHVEENTPEIDAYIDDFLDFDKYKKPTSLFFDFSRYNFSTLTNESDSITADISVYIVVRNASSEILKKHMLSYAQSFMAMFYAGKNNFNGIVDNGTITAVSFFSAVQGTPSVKVCEIEITITTEN